jgi:D-serine deaminase-like pyridoxal phosphate-dependent protein
MTAEVSLSLQQLADNADKLSVESQQHGLCWVPVVTGAMPREVRAVLRKSALGPIACHDATTAIELRDDGCKSIWIRQAIVDTDQLRELVRVDTASQLHFTIDHFVHAEWINAACNPASIAKCLLEMRSDASAGGVRPGRDALMLADAIAGLSRVECQGLYAHEWQDGNAGGIECGAAAADLMRAAIATVQLFRRREHACSTVAITEGMLPDLKRAEAEVSWWVGDATVFGCGRTASEVGLPAAITIRCRVISRPQLSIAIVNAGRTETGACRCGPRVQRPAGAEVAAIADDALSLKLSGAARDLRIGDWVTLAVAATPVVLQHARLKHC